MYSMGTGENENVSQVCSALLTLLESRTRQLNKEDCCCDCARRLSVLPLCYVSNNSPLHILS